MNYSHGDAGVVAQSTRTFGDEITAVYESNAATALFVGCSLAKLCDKNSEDIVAALLAAGAKPNHDQYKKGRCNTPLMAACYRGKFTSLFIHYSYFFLLFIILSIFLFLFIILSISRSILSLPLSFSYPYSYPFPFPFPYPFPYPYPYPCSS